MVWSTYFATDDVDALAARVQEFGGKSLFDPMDVMDAGRMGFFTHEAGGAFGAWQAGTHRGAELVNEPGSLAWNTLITPHPEDAAAFFGLIFGLGTETQVLGSDDYVIFTLGERGVAGLMGPPPGMPDGVPAFWGVSFAVADADATAALAVERGGVAADGADRARGRGADRDRHGPLGRLLQRRRALGLTTEGADR